MIEDKELRDLFKIECEEHLQHLSDGLLRLEKEPKDEKTLDEIFREAHSLKGAGRMVGVPGVETIAHRFEDILGAAKKGKAVLTSDTIDRLYKGLDSIRRLVNEAVTGESSGVDVEEALNQISEFGVRSAESLRSAEGVVRSEELEKEEEKTDVKKDVESREPSKIEIKEQGIATPHSALGTPHFKIETVRVDTRILDMLMTQAGELIVTKTHIGRRLLEIEEIIDLWEDINVKREASFVKRESRFEIRNTLHEIRDTRYEILGTLLNQLKTGASEDSARLDLISSKLEDGIRKTRLIPLSTIFNLYPRMVRDMAREQSKEVNCIVEGGETAADKRIIEEMKDPLMHMIRNSIDHGIERPEEREKSGKPSTGTITLRAYQTAVNIVIEVSDDGRGLDTEAIKRSALKRKVCREDELAAMTPAQIESLVFTSGFSTSSFVSEVSGRGVGLDVVRANVDRLKGTITLESYPGAGCRFRVQLPVTLATVRVLIATSDERKYAIPVEHVVTSRMVSAGDIFPIAGRQTITFDGEPVSVARLSDIVEREAGSGKRNELRNTKYASRDTLKVFPCIILSVGREKLGIIVDSLIDEQEVVLKPQSAILKHVRNVSGATVLATGEVCMVLNPNGLLKSIQTHPHPFPPLEVEGQELSPGEGTLPFPPLPQGEGRGEGGRKKTILLVEDSITTRTQEKRILDGAGYEVVVAVDGLDALTKLNSREFDGVVSDILMPNMDGLTLTEKIRQDKRFKELPVILVTSLASDEDRKKGMEAGANAYISKPTFDQKVLLEILGRLV